MISLETARQLLDFGGGSATQKARLSAARAEEQLEGAVALHNLLEKDSVAYLADEVGLGKTYVALGAFALFRHFNPEFRLMVLAPRRNIQLKWIRELQNFTRNNVRFSDLRIRGIQGLPARPPVNCENLYELVRETSLDPDRDFFTRLTSFSFGMTDRDGEGWKRRRDRLRELLPWLPDGLLSGISKERFKENYARAVCCALPVFDLVIVDEGHNLKGGLQKTAALRNRLVALAFGNDSARGYEGGPRLRHYGPRARKVLFLSATPIEDDYRQLWNQLDVFGLGERAPELANAKLTEEEKRRAVSRFLIRRVGSIRSSGTDLTRNLYRREWRGGGVADHDDALPVPDDRQRLILALVQKKVSEVLEHERFNHSFQIGMLASFESFLQTAVPEQDSTGVFDDPDQTDDHLEREGIDVGSVNRLAESYRRHFHHPMPHPKMDAIVESLKTSFDSGRKALIFVRRVASVKEIRVKLEAFYDDWLFARLRSELPAGVQDRLESLLVQYREAKHARGAKARQAASKQNAGEEPGETDVADDTGGIDTFFAWFFRGDGPPGVFSGAAVARRFVQSRFSLSSFFADNYVAGLLNVRPAGVFKALLAVTERSAEDLTAELERRAGNRLSAEARRRSHGDLFMAFQYAGLSLLAEKGPYQEAARNELRAFAANNRGGEPVTLGDWLKRETFFSRLRQHPDLAGELWLAPADAGLDRGRRFVRRELRRELIASLFRLGHSYIDLYIAIIKRLARLDSGASEGEDLDNALLADDLIGVLTRQRSGQTFRAYQELREAAEHFDLIIDTNAHDLWNSELDAVPAAIGRLLRAQQPVGGMFGEVNKTLVTQFRMPGYPLTLISTDLLQEGEDLHLFCSDVYHYGISWMPSSMEQRIGRIDRVRSHTERRLTDLTRNAAGGDLLQVYYPYLRETVEVFQVNHVLERMDRFMRMMHEGFGMSEEHPDKRINILRESQRSSGSAADSRGLLRSAFPIRRDLLKGARKRLRVDDGLEAKLLHRFQRIQHALEESGGVVWRPVDRTSARVGTIRVGQRQQAFTMFLHSIQGHVHIRCVSPIGEIDLEANTRQIAQASRGLPIRVAAVFDPHFRRYNLTAEADVLLGDRTSDAERATWLVRSTARAADCLEETLIELDQDAGAFHGDLIEEATVER